MSEIKKNILVVYTIKLYSENQLKLLPTSSVNNNISSFSKLSHLYILKYYITSMTCKDACYSMLGH